MMNVQGTNIHVIIAPTSWQGDPLKYRRHRLAEYLNALEDTCEVIWIAPMPTNRPRHMLIRLDEERLPNGITQLTIANFKNLGNHFRLLQYALHQRMKAKFRVKQTYYLWYTYPAFSHLINLKIWDTVIYDCSDHWNRADQTRNKWLHKIKKRWITKTERKIAQHANLCFTSSVFLFHYVSKYLKNENVVLIENGVDYAQFSTDTGVKKRSDKPNLGFVGGLKPWKIDFGLLLAVAQAKPEWRFTLIGATYGTMPKAYEELRKLSNVTVIKAIPFTDIPGKIKQFSVGLLPYLNNEYNNGVMPLKLFEYIAGNLPVVGCGLPSTRHYVEDLIYLHVDNHLDSFIKACEQALHWQDKGQERRQQLAQNADWYEKFSMMWGMIKDKKIGETS